MTEAERITRALGGDWRHGQGLAPCPICQPEGRRDQRALSLSDSGGRLLVHCHKSGCAALNELRNRGLAEGRGQPSAAPDPAELARKRAEDQRREAQRLKSAHDLFAAAERDLLADVATARKLGLHAPKYPPKEMSA